MKPTYAGKPEPTGTFIDATYPRNEGYRGPQFLIAVNLTEPVDQTWLSMLRAHSQAQNVAWDEEASEVSTLTVWTPIPDVTPTLNGLDKAISDTNEEYAEIQKLKPQLEAEIELWWQHL